MVGKSKVGYGPQARWLIKNGEDDDRECTDNNGEKQHLAIEVTVWGMLHDFGFRIYLFYVFT